MKPIKQLLTKPYKPFEPPAPSKTYVREELEEVCELEGTHGGSAGDDVFDLKDIYDTAPDVNLAELSVSVRYNGDYDPTLLVGKIVKTVKENKAYDAQMKHHRKAKQEYDQDCMKYEADLKAYEEQQAEILRNKDQVEIKAAQDILKKHGLLK